MGEVRGGAGHLPCALVPARPTHSGADGGPGLSGSCPETWAPMCALVGDRKAARSTGVLLESRPAPCVLTPLTFTLACAWLGLRVSCHLFLFVFK